MLELAEGERAAASALHLDMRAYQALCAETLKLIDSSIEAAVLSNAVDVESLAAKVNLALLIRLGQDLRTASILVALGYAAQALSIVAGAFETAFTLAYIGNDEVRAVAWRDHDDPTRPYRAVYRLIKDVITEQGWPEQVEGQYRIYRQLCMGKHGNPLFTKAHFFRERRDRVGICLCLNSGETAVRALQFALEQAAGLGGMAVRAFLLSFGGTEMLTLGKRLYELDQSWKALHEQAVTRWGTADPFPGKW